MAHGVTERNREVVAEHVEEAETMDLLSAYGVEYGQGYHRGRPEEFPLEPASVEA